ncbi:MAG: exodeoxyribonuclease VII small subunit [Clostridia bacterium]|nr:exodeoxyribonuclease VII small subunit [Clostridia bacterium]
MSEDSKKSFEKNLGELEQVVRALEASDVSLDDMIALFEKGVHLTRECTDALNTAEQKITVLMKNRDGEMEEEPFAGLSE